MTPLTPLTELTLAPLLFELSISQKDDESIRTYFLKLTVNKRPVEGLKPVRRGNPLMMMLSFIFEICESCTFENDIRQSNSICVVFFASRNSDANLNNAM